MTMYTINIYFEETELDEDSETFHIQANSSFQALKDLFATLHWKEFENKAILNIEIEL